MSATYNQAATAVAQYGKDRAAVAQIAAGRPDAAAINAKFEAMDAAIGKAAGDTPNRKEGKSLADDFEKAAELIAKAVERAAEAIKSAFGRGGPDANPTSRPSNRP